MSVPTNVACHQNPIEPLVRTVSCSGNFFPWLHAGLLEMGLGVDGQSDLRKNCRVWDQLTSTACGCPRFWGEACVSYLLCLLLSERIHPWESKLGWMDYSQNPELLEGGNGAEALPATFTETSIDMKAMCSSNSAPLPPLAAKVLSTFHFIYSNSPKSDCSNWPALG